MAFVLNDDGLTSLTIRYVERKRDGSFQYRRRIPTSLQGKYAGRIFFVKSLKRDASKISQLAYDLTNQLTMQWAEWQGIIETKKLFVLSSIVPHPPPERIQPSGDDVVNRERGNFNLGQALTLYLDHHKNGKKLSFKEDCNRVIASAIDLLGDRSIGDYERPDAEKLRDHWLKQGATRTARRRLITLVAIINKARKEKQLQILNPFEGLGIAGEGEDGIQRLPFIEAELSIVSLACRNLDDDIRHIIALQKDTGCRVAEIVGLRVEDVSLEQPVPHIRIRPWGKVRTLKTPASERNIPLVGDALWAAEHALETRGKAKEPGFWMFPRYASDQIIKATHASNTLNKWLRGLEGVSSDKTTHCFRHAFRDRLRAAQVPLEIQDCLGGWGTRTVGQGYGSGYPLQVLAEHMVKLTMGA